MGSTVLTSRLALRTLPFLAILRHDLRSLRESWLVRIWLVGASLLTLVVATANWGHLPTAHLVASLLIPYLILPWFLVVMVLGVNPISGSRMEALADGFLSRPVTRHEFLLAVWAARVVAVLATYLLVMIPAVVVVVFAKRPAPIDHVTLYGVVAALAVVGLVLVFQVSLAFLVGTLLRRPLAAIVCLLFLWGPVNLVLDSFRLEAFSPISLNRALPRLLHQPWRAGEDAAADRVGENDFAAAANFFGMLLGGESQRPPDKEKSFFENAEQRDFSLWKVLLGYGLPTLAAVGLATVVFSRRDL